MQYALTVGIEYSAADCKVTSKNGMSGGLIGSIPENGGYISTSTFSFIGCEWLKEADSPQDIAGNTETLEKTVADKNLQEKYNVTIVSDAKNLHAASVAFPPIIKLIENVPYHVEAAIFPRKFGNKDEIAVSWAETDKSSLKITKGNLGNVVLKGLKAGNSGITALLTGFLGGNSWTLNSIVNTSLVGLTSLVLDKKEISLSGTGSTQEVTASITPENGASYPELMWSYKAISGDAATDNDLEITYIESTHKVKVTLVNFIEGAQYRLTATTKDGTDLSASLVILANADPATSRGGNSGGCSAANCGPLALLTLIPAAFMTTRCKHRHRR
ncbi:hypothetical protein HF883_11015 [Cloacibacillus porcorum]|uniref:hypothetical protein n=1 Tax=Cloacibacillus porcorum TaxID=1197717 RepID=UPI001459E41E|nr:hypothetical protein [Cloacibacillus porcorum]MDY5390195.1 hypothetical protein [Cloacibacillus porcorum]NMF18751.1 hypothetical protein [Cloacibacillus porcorum]